jgi:cell wall-associated NlpC family hydrolase
MAIIQNPGSYRQAIASGEPISTGRFTAGGREGGWKAVPGEIKQGAGAVSGAAGGSAKMTAILNYATGQVGKPYIWGGVGPKGYDCSGLIYMAYKSAGVNIPRTTAGQIISGINVPNMSMVRPGDLIFPRPGHVFMAIGNGQAVEAPRTGLKLRIIPLPSKAFAIRRYLNNG